MKKTDWKDITSFYNQIFGLNFKTSEAMLRSCYKRFGSLKEAGLKLGISGETMRLKMRSDGSKITKTGKWKRRKEVKHL